MKLKQDYGNVVNIFFVKITVNSKQIPQSLCSFGMTTVKEKTRGTEIGDFVANLCSSLPPFEYARHFEQSEKSVCYVGNFSYLCKNLTHIIMKKQRS